eukprot:4921312-Pyramimonas_sp.AAC.1
MHACATTVSLPRLVPLANLGRGPVSHAAGARVSLPRLLIVPRAPGRMGSDHVLFAAVLRLERVSLQAFCPPRK